MRWILLVQKYIRVTQYSSLYLLTLTYNHQRHISPSGSWFARPSRRGSWTCPGCLWRTAILKLNFLSKCICGMHRCRPGGASWWWPCTLGSRWCSCPRRGGSRRSCTRRGGTWRAPLAWGGGGEDFCFVFRESIIPERWRIVREPQPHSSRFTTVVLFSGFERGTIGVGVRSEDWRQRKIRVGFTCHRNFFWNLIRDDSTAVVSKGYSCPWCEGAPFVQFTLYYKVYPSGQLKGNFYRKKYCTGWTVTS